MELRSQYWEDPVAKAAFQQFMIAIFGLDFTEWDRQGYWDEAYTPFSYFEGGRVISSVCIYHLDVLIQGRQTKLAQISGVGTLPERRRRGLNRELTTEALEWFRGRHEGIFLFADDEAVPFYERCGFLPLEEFVEGIEVDPVPPRPGMTRLDPGVPEHLSRIEAYSLRRSPVSRVFSLCHHKLFMFHVLYPLRASVMEVEELDCLVLGKRDGSVLRIFDIVAESIPPFSELYPYLADQSDRTVEFHFSTDLLGLEAVVKRPLVGNNPFVQGDFPLEEVVFPFTARA